MVMNKKWREYRRNRSVNYTEVEPQWSGSVHIGSVCQGEPGTGGYGYVINGSGFRVERSGGYTNTREHRMKLMALAKALDAIPEDAIVTVYTDAQNMALVFNKGWAEEWRKNGWMRRRDEPVRNPDLLERCLLLLKYRKVTIIYVGAENRSKELNRAVELAEAASHENNLEIDLGHKA